MKRFLQLLLSILPLLSLATSLAMPSNTPTQTKSYIITPKGKLDVAEATSPTYQVSILSDIAESYNKDPSKHFQNVALKDVQIAVDSEDVTLQNIINQIIAQASSYTGPWEVKWRLKPENTYILEQKVNLIAQGTFNEFMYHLTERVKNMTGTQLFISNFDAARVIIISDTHY